jgi:hypothetical protein
LTSCSTGTDRSIPWRVRVSEWEGVCQSEEQRGVFFAHEAYFTARTLQNFEVLDVSIFGIDIEFDTAHGYIHYMNKSAGLAGLQPGSIASEMANVQ